MLSRKCLETPNVTLCTKSIAAKLGKSIDSVQKAKQFWRWWMYISMPNSDHSFHAFSIGCPNPPKKVVPFHRVKLASKLGKSSDRDLNTMSSKEVSTHWYANLQPFFQAFSKPFPKISRGRRTDVQKVCGPVGHSVSHSIRYRGNSWCYGGMTDENSGNKLPLSPRPDNDALVAWYQLAALMEKTEHRKPPPPPSSNL